MSLDATSLWSPADRAAVEAALDQLDQQDRAEQWRHNGPAWTRDRLGEFLWSKQREIMHSIRDHRFTAVKACHGPGKALELGTVLPTPDGWTTMEKVQVGDFLLDEHGKPVEVLAVSGIQHRPTYRVVFDDRTEIVASDHHEWQVIDIRHRPRRIADWRDHWAATVTRTTEQLAAEVRENGQYRWRVPTCRPIEGQRADFPIPGYTLGAWLGDGHSAEAVITASHDDAPETLAQIEADGFTTRPRPAGMRERSGAWGILGLWRLLRDTGLMGNKHVPAAILRADVETRLAVLQGLMDTDGFCTRDQSVGIDLCNQRLADGVAELVASLGWKTFRSTKAAKLDGRVVGTVYKLLFRPDRPVFRLRRKAEKLGRTVGQTSRHTQRTIVAVEPIEMRPTKCCMVDSPTHLYLAGASMVPTHNSRVASRIAAWWMETHPPGEARVVSTAPTFPQVEAILWSEINDAATKAAGRGEPFRGRVLATEWKIGNQLLAFGRKPSDHNPHAFQGIHAKYVLVIIDEACGVVQNFWTAALALSTGRHCRILALGNPDDPASKFAEVCSDPQWNVITISAFDTPNFTGEPVPQELADVLVDQVYVDDMAREYGEESPTYISKVLGEFPVDSDDGVIRLSALRSCSLPTDTPRTGDELLPVELGVDFGAGGDTTVIRERRGPLVGRTWRTQSKDGMHTVGLVLQAIRETGATAVKCDVIGIGFGLTARLRELADTGAHQARIVPVNVSEASRDPARWLRTRSEMWWMGRQLAEDRRWDLSGLEDRDRERLISQLVAPHYQLDSSGRIVVETKDDTKKRINRSPDDADALLMAFWQPAGSAAGALDWLKQAKRAG